MNVLIVDDKEANRLLIKSFLSSRGHSTLEAANGDEACNIYSEFESDIDLIIMDVLMPVESGISAARKIRGQAGGSDIRILFITAYDDQETVEQCRLLGDEFIEKPVDLDELEQKIKCIF